MDNGLLDKTGKSLEEWIAIVEVSKISKHTEIISFLKSEYGLTYGFANLIALKARKSDAGSFPEEDLLASQYKGKEELKDIYNKLISGIAKFGDDITITPKKDSVSIIRKKQFALIKPASKIRIDLGLKIKDKAFTERLQNSGPFGTMCSHRVQLTNIDEVNSELLNWLKEAYEGAK